MPLDFCIVDTFSSIPLKGGPSAVFFVDDDIFKNDILMQNIAMELYTPETIFVKKVGLHDFEVSCFTPLAKGMLLGNGLFAASYILSTIQEQGSKNINFILGDRIFEAEGNRVRFPIPKIEKEAMSDSISNSLSGEIIVSVAKSSDNYLIVELRSPKKLAKLDPNIDKLFHTEYDVVMITSDNHYERDWECDYYARVFAPKFGIFEDNITPIAHLKLASYWSERLQKNHLVGCQDSKKECFINVEIQPDEGYTYIFGECSLVTKGTLFL